MNPGKLPVGEPIDRGPGERPERKEYRGKFVRLLPVDPERDVDRLFPASHGTELRERLWTYMGYGPFPSVDAMREWLRESSASSDPLFLTVHLADSDRPVGIVSFLNIVPAALRLELGHIWYVPDFQRTAINTEAVYLMLREAFDALRYRRVEWKCDSLNERSRAAALRLGFTFEGIFRQHLIVKGRNRDTAWYSMLDSEWPRAKANSEAWLYEDGGRKSSLASRNAARPGKI